MIFMSTLQEFLNENTVEGITAEVPVSNRFRDKEGKLLKFKIKPLTDKEFESYRKKAMKMSMNNGGEVELDNSKFVSQIVINHTIDPNFKDAKSIEKTSCHTPDQYLSKVLLAGEVNELAQQIQKLSGFNQSFSELVEEAKN